MKRGASSVNHLLVSSSLTDRSQIINLVIKVGLLRLLRLLRLPWQQQQWQPIRNTAGNCPLFPFPSLSFFPSTLFLTVNFDGSTSKQSGASGASTAYYELIAVKRRCQPPLCTTTTTTQSTLNDQFEVQRRRRKKRSKTVATNEWEKNNKIQHSQNGKKDTSIFCSRRPSIVNDEHGNYYYHYHYQSRPVTGDKTRPIKSV